MTPEPGAPLAYDEQPHLLQQLAAMQQQIAALQQQLASMQQQLAATQQQLAAVLSQLATPPPAARPLIHQEQTRPAPPAPKSVPTIAIAPGEPVLEPVRPTEFVPLSLILEQDANKRMLLIPNGVSESGQPLLQIDAAAARQLAQEHPEPEELHAVYKTKKEQQEKHRGVIFGVNEDKLNESQWAIVVHSDEDVAVLKALTPLIQHRSAQQGLNLPELTFREGERCGEWLKRHVKDTNKPLQSNVPVLLYQPNERSTQWLARHGVGQGPVDPRRGVPFYLMLVGRPGPLDDKDIAFIPFDFQYELDIFWGVGQLCFHTASGQHDLAAYNAYAEQVVAFDQNESSPPYQKYMAFFGTRHSLDTSTERSADELVTPLAHPRTGVAQVYGFNQRVFLEGEATRANLDLLLKGTADGGRPALLFTATHGIGLPVDDSRLLQHQGALVCQDWSGSGSIKREYWYAGEDLSEQTNVQGLIAVCFACYGVGCPREDQFIFVKGKERPIIAPYPFIAQLPQRLLTRGALAVLGHVERAWTYSFSGTLNVPAQSQPFEDLLRRILAGKRMGFATDQFNMRQGAFAAQLTQEIEQMEFGKVIKPADLSVLWTARNDARNYALLGDPAVRLPWQSQVIPRADEQAGEGIRSI